MNYKIIAVDMDGTLLNDEKGISDYNLKMIKRAEEKGVKFVIASGRVPAGLKFYEDSISKNQPMICGNGSKILDHNKNIIFSNPMNKDSIFKVIDVVRQEREDTYFHFYEGDKLCSEQFNHGTKRFYNFIRKIDKKYRLEIRLIKDAKDYVKSSKDRIDKLIVIDDDIDYIDRLRKKIDSLDIADTTKSEINNIEIMAKGTSKGNALKILAEHYGVSIQQCIAIGNDENDISMIDAAGLGVCVKNGRSVVKEYANYITDKDNNEGAIGEVIEKFVL